MTCVNENCENDWDTPTKQLVTVDGDFACCKKCKIEWEKQRDHFFNVVIHDDKKFENWMGVKIE